MSSFLLEEIEERNKQLKKIAPIREHFLKLLDTCQRVRVDRNTVKLIVKK